MDCRGIRQGKRVTIKLELLSEKDQDFAKGLLEKDKNAEFRANGFKEGKYAEELQDGFKVDGVEFRFTRIEDSVHNSIHWKLAKGPEVFEWLFTQVTKG